MATQANLSFAKKHGHVRTRDCAFVMAFLPVNQCWATWREERDGTVALLELHTTRTEADLRLTERISFQRAVEG